MNQVTGLTVIPSAIARGNVVPPNPRLVLLVLAAHAGDSDGCNIRRAVLVKESGLSESTVKRSVRWLKDEGYITVSQNTREDGGYTASTYQLNLTAYAGDAK